MTFKTTTSNTKKHPTNSPSYLSRNDKGIHNKTHPTCSNMGPTPPGEKSSSSTFIRRWLSCSVTWHISHAKYGNVHHVLRLNTSTVWSESPLIYVLHMLIKHISRTCFEVLWSSSMHVELQLRHLLEHILLLELTAQEQETDLKFGLSINSLNNSLSNLRRWKRCSMSSAVWLILFV